MFIPTQVTEWLDIYFRKNRSDKDLQPFIDSIYNQWLELIEEDRIRFRSKVGSFHKMYEYITQVVDLKDRPELEGYYLFFSMLHRLNYFISTSTFRYNEKFLLNRISLMNKKMFLFFLRKKIKRTKPDHGTLMVE